jgi:hypothetical protein
MINHHRFVLVTTFVVVEVEAKKNENQVIEKLKNVKLNVILEKELILLH